MLGKTLETKNQNSATNMKRAGIKTYIAPGSPAWCMKGRKKHSHTEEVQFYEQVSPDRYTRGGKKRILLYDSGNELFYAKGSKQLDAPAHELKHTCKESNQVLLGDVS